MADPRVQEVLQAFPRWRLHPLVADQKTPLLKSWQTKASNDPGQIESWDEQFPGCNWGLATGAASGVLVFDADGEEARGVLLGLAPGLAETLTVRTPRPGYHFYVAWPTGTAIRNSAGKLGPGLDVRGEGGYVVIPPSKTAKGRYEWLNA